MVKFEGGLLLEPKEFDAHIINLLDVFHILLRKRDFLTSNAEMSPNLTLIQTGIGLLTDTLVNSLKLLACLTVEIGS